MLLIAYLIDFIHFMALLFPLYMYLIPVNHLKFLFKYIFLAFIMTPIGWGVFDNCWMSKLTSTIDDDKDTFTRKRMGFIYNPIIRFFGLDWNNEEHLDIIVNIHLGINYIIMWYYLFFVIKCKLV
tara:strand:- start:632 stop:1006 length:375 start_codon:yes stop_codon:yes gene_type:complete